ncbi:hypothetical protein E4U36_000699, partial [Claviceps purpurea]
DLFERCIKLKITAIIWKSDHFNPSASVVFVTPESAVTEGFQDFVRRLQNRAVLDRVVVDECHTLLDGDFRPTFSKVGKVIRSWGVQRLFLTATLEPDEMGKFYEVAAISPTQSIVFRSKTTRPNIQYRVIKIESAYKNLEDEENKKVCEIVRQWLRQSQEGKAIVYTGSVDRVKRIGATLHCGTYYSGVDTAEGKKDRLKTWIQGERAIVATSALGLGIDVADVRLVVHACMPRSKGAGLGRWLVARVRTRGLIGWAMVGAGPGRAGHGLACNPMGTQVSRIAGKGLTYAVKLPPEN